MNNNIRHKGWNDMSRILDQQMPTKTKPIAVWWWLSGAAALVILGLSIFIWQANTTDNYYQSPIALSNFPLTADEAYDTYSNHIENDLNENVTEQFDDLSSSLTTATAQSSVTTSSTAQTINHTNIGQNVFSERSDADKSQSKGQTSSMISPTAYHAADANNNVISIHNQNYLTVDQLPLANVDDLLLYNSRVEALPFKDHLPVFSSISSSSNTTWKRFAMLSAGANVSVPFSYVSQVDIGLERRLSDKWSYQIGMGAGINGLYYQPDVALVQFRSSFDSQSETNIDNNFDLANGSEVDLATLDLQRNYFAYIGTYARYDLSAKWKLWIGAELSYRFNIVLNGPTQKEETLAGLMPTRSYNSSEIEELFLIFNRWNISPAIGISYDFNQKFGLHLRYRHGLNGLIAHPVEGYSGIHSRNIQVGGMYYF